MIGTVLIVGCFALAAGSALSAEVLKVKDLLADGWEIKGFSDYGSVQTYLLQKNSQLIRCVGADPLSYSRCGNISDYEVNPPDKVNLR
jgi:hypothetical protein